MDKAKILAKMNFLYSNQILAIKGLNGMDSYFSNCHGTVAHVLGVEDYFERKAQKIEDFVHVEGRPSCLDRDLMKDFLETQCELVKDNYRFGDIVALWSNIHRKTADMPQPKTRAEMLKMLHLPPVKTIEHSAILIEPKTEKVFHQQEYGREFEFNTINEYITKWFPDFRGRGVNLFVDFYRIKNNCK